MATSVKFLNKPIAEVKPTAVVPDFEQLPKTADTIKCPACGLIQPAAIVETRPEPTFLHTCAKCGQVIDKDLWHSVL
ncbi:hypothetical protein SAMN05216327_101229 [Dyadobacter sp. SG02]|uniref:hypothetical protein n=1 Tax=Dyadobacter sp. SG02 TaxID=1855291 RepID=UPI0008D5A665|nr:hypothetical protein [Dyadobacter sp. SG02]SEI39804.1 hypothetical protein SAMN05216327_101229 [Dyadobacter sp. SG02]